MINCSGAYKSGRTIIPAPHSTFSLHQHTRRSARGRAIFIPHYSFFIRWESRTLPLYSAPRGGSHLSSKCGDLLGEPYLDYLSVKLSAAGRFGSPSIPGVNCLQRWDRFPAARRLSDSGGRGDGLHPPRLCVSVYELFKCNLPSVRVFALWGIVIICL